MLFGQPPKTLAAKPKHMHGGQIGLPDRVASVVVSIGRGQDDSAVLLQQLQTIVDESMKVGQMPYTLPAGFRRSPCPVGSDAIMACFSWAAASGACFCVSQPQNA